MTVRCRTFVTGMLVCAALSGCSAATRLPAVPTDRTTQAVPLGVPNARYYVDVDLSDFTRDAMKSIDRERATLAASGKAGQPLPAINFLAISGGGDDGAFGAGLLIGWTEAGTRPEFKGVTGISTGALMAPFAFLGPRHDKELREVYTAVGPKDIYESRSVLAALTSDAMADSRPLWNLLSKYVTADLLTEIAAEYAKGRMLLIATTNLDARRPVIWNMGEIATSTEPRALDLFRKIMIASASLPGAFPPVMIDVEVDGKAYQEMHVDGGAVAQVFMYPPGLTQAVIAAGGQIAERERQVYVIRNTRIDPNWAEIDRRMFSILGRAITSMFQSQGIGDLYRIYVTAQQDKIDFNLAFIGSEFTTVHKEEFDTAYMRALFDYGYQLARKGYPWRKVPPGMVAPAATAK
jgi:predicted acylesterase/phospholipase RssA